MDTFTCPGCAHVYERDPKALPDSMLGATVVCRECGTQFDLSWERRFMGVRLMVKTRRQHGEDRV